MAKKTGSKKSKASKKTAKATTVKAPKAEKAKRVKVETKVENLTTSTSGNVARMLRGREVTVHDVVNGKGLCGEDVTTVSLSLKAAGGGFATTKSAVACTRCIKAKANGTKTPKVKKEAAAKASRKSVQPVKSAAARSRKA